MLSIDDLGVLRSIEEVDGRVVVTITPTYSGCPAMDHIAEEIRSVLDDAGFAGEVHKVLSPAWTTDWMSAAGRQKLRDYGIAPPHIVAADDGASIFVHLRERVQCPRCGSSNTMIVSEFGSTACKAHYRCVACAEPFDYFKEF